MSDKKPTTRTPELGAVIENCWRRMVALWNGEGIPDFSNLFTEKTLFRGIIVILGACLLWFIIGICCGIRMETIGDWFLFLYTVFTGVAVVAAISAYMLQSKQLKEQGGELKRQASLLEQDKFERTFFSMLHHYDSLLESLHRGSLGHEKRGREALEDMAQGFEAYYSSHRNKGCQEALKNSISPDSDFWANFLGDILDYVDKYGKSDTNTYWRIVMGQLSRRELQLLFYFALQPEKSSLKSIIEGHGLFQGIRDDVLVRKEDRQLYSANAFGEES